MSEDERQPRLPIPPPPPRDETDDPVSVVIPYKNPPALIAYYLAVFSLIPCLGILLGIAAVILGIMGLVYARDHEHARGRFHAWVGIVGGGLIALLNIVGLVLMVVLPAMSD